MAQWNGRATPFHAQNHSIGSVGTQIKGQDSPPLLTGGNHHRSGPVTEKDAGIAVRPVDKPANQFNANHQRGIPDQLEAGVRAMLLDTYYDDADQIVVLDEGRIAISALAVGLSQGCVDESVRYSKDRVAFGRPIGPSSRSTPSSTA